MILDNPTKACAVSVGNSYIDSPPLQRISVHPWDILADSSDLRPPHQHLERTVPTQETQILPRFPCNPPSTPSEVLNLIHHRRLSRPMKRYSLSYARDVPCSSAKQRATSLPSVVGVNPTGPRIINHVDNPIFSVQIQLVPHPPATYTGTSSSGNFSSWTVRTSSNVARPQFPCSFHPHA